MFLTPSQSRESEMVVDEEGLGEMRDEDDTRKEAMIYIETLGMYTNEWGK